MRTRRVRSDPIARSAFAGFCFPPDVIVLAVRWYLRFALSYRDVEELLAEAARPCRHAVAGHWRYVYRAIDQFGQVIDVFMSTRRDAAAARRFFKRAIRTTKVTPIEVVTDRAPAYLTVLDDLLEATWHRTERYANNQVEADHGRLKHGSGRCEGSNRNSAPAS